jgi:hydroxymethylbilane synthase
LLARVQAEAVGRALGRMNPNIDVQYRWIESTGDQMVDQPLNDAGGKGLFTKAVELALLKGDADLAVHSCKDMPTDLTPGLIIAAIPKRGDVRDCLISPDAQTIRDLPRNATIGTASPRRAAQLQRLRGDLEFRLLRGNIQTRLRKVLEDRVIDATLLAVAGLKRAKLGQYANKPIDTDTMLPSANQGALAVQCRTDDSLSMTRCLPLNDPVTSAAVYFERAVIAGLHGNCHSSIAVLAEPTDAEARTFRLRARVLSGDGEQCLELTDVVETDDLADAAKRMVDSFVKQGAAALLRSTTPAQTTAV